MDEPNYEALSVRLKVLAHPERLRILDVLRHEPECVCHLEALLGKPQPYCACCARPASSATRNKDRMSSTQSATQK